MKWRTVLTCACIATSCILFLWALQSAWQASLPGFDSAQYEQRALAQFLLGTLLMLLPPLVWLWRRVNRARKGDQR